ncbi:S9 family peptidase [Pseudidiomarina terrestris]|uniref:S9 family peptidase n=1 Tax=Pseudidiomarina terrestris TaxID=2820060 RepID=A0AAW7R0E6_9GAMM|nr:MULTISPECIES: S9 family peptidase [unclassified Pseudidiomarina]MDN7124593.1 S9 family peptidase [Pseudidiomarina sp. 1APP75-32.1]MDN7126861.1 S9 family peptidase [Pseudidiomarina sp. 1APR75-33.1]MDN7129116.1 S9 family peptidase [Pseudidiomarina sp. 1APR75-15]MDN7134620.1 S9 family peptidase [Pseudidiomarina sp. 1ASP75-5]MDN7136710.1 S9 family peptidase [Pseudidiomarina sp. 1ASP75-14]
MANFRMFSVALLGLTLSYSANLLAQTEDSTEPSATRTLNNGNLVLESIPTIPVRIGEQLTRYQNIRSAAFRSFNADGDAIYISTRFGDVAQIHKVSEAGGYRQQLTFFAEPVGGIARQPGSNAMIFSMDAGGNEFSQLFKLDPASGDYHMLSDGESRNGAVVWSHDGSKFAYQSTRRDGRSNDIWVMDPEQPEQAELVVAAPDGSWWGPVDWNHDGSKLLVVQYRSITDVRIHELDVQEGELSLLEGNEMGSNANFPLAYRKDGEGFFFTTDQFSDFTQLAFRNTTTGEVAVITDDIAWNVDNFALSDDGERAAFTINEEGISQLYRLNPETFAMQRVEGLPVGVVGGLTYSPDGSRLALSINTPKSPTDVYVLNNEDQLTRWTYSEVGGLNTENFVEPELVKFNSFDGLQVPAFVYKPQQQGPHPVIISIHGGPESQYRPYFSGTIQMWIQQLGAAVIAPNVRGSAGYGSEYVSLDNGFNREDSVKDIGALLDWVEAQPDLDASRVAVIGGSYGGYMVLASAVHYSDRLQAAVDIVGISNFVTFLTNTEDYRRDLRRAEYGDERDPEMRAHLTAISPNNHVDKIDVPMFVVQGENDPRVPVSEADQIVAALKANNKTVWYMNALNEGHGYRKKENRDIYEQATVLFFESYLLPKD